MKIKRTQDSLEPQRQQNQNQSDIQESAEINKHSLKKTDKKTENELMNINEAQVKKKSFRAELDSSIDHKSSTSCEPGPVSLISEQSNTKTEIHLMSAEKRLFSPPPHRSVRALKEMRGGVKGGRGGAPRLKTFKHLSAE